MNKFHQSILIAVMFSFGISTVSAAPEDIPGTNLTVDFSKSILSGAGRLIRATNIPVQSAGTTVYYDVEMDFRMLSDNSFGAQLISATPSTGAVEPTSVSTMNFLPGTYAGIAPGSPVGALPCFFSLSEPSIGADGRRTYLLTVTSSGTGCPVGMVSRTNITSYSWQTGPAVHNGLIGWAGNPGSGFVNGSSLTYAYGLDSTTILIRTLQIGNTLTVEPIQGTDATSAGSALTLVKQ